MTAKRRQVNIAISALTQAQIDEMMAQEIATTKTALVALALDRLHQELARQQEEKDG